MTLTSFPSDLLSIFDSASGGLHAGFEYYRAVPEDTIQNMNYSKTKLTTPVPSSLRPMI